MPSLGNNNDNDDNSIDILLAATFVSVTAYEQKQQSKPTNTVKAPTTYLPFGAHCDFHADFCSEECHQGNADSYSRCDDSGYITTTIISTPLPFVSPSSQSQPSSRDILRQLQNTQDDMVKSNDGFELRHGPANDGGGDASSKTITNNADGVGGSNASSKTTRNIVVRLDRHPDAVQLTDKKLLSYLSHLSIHIHHYTITSLHDLAVFHKRYGISFARRDVYVNVVGGMHLGKGSKGGGGGSDLAVAIAAVSSLVGIPVRADTAFVGEVGLLGELRPVHSLEKRIGEARRMGFSRIVTPSSVRRKKKSSRSKGGGNGGTIPGPKEVSAGGIKQLMCDNVLDAINCGLVDRLPTKQTRGGPKLRKPKRSKDDVSMYEQDIILDDEDDLIFE